MTTETTQAPPALWCDNPEHAEAGSAVPAIYRVTWPDGRFRPALACKDCLEDSLSLYVLNGDSDGRRHPALIELAESVIEADEAKVEHFARDASLLAGARIISHTLDRLARTVEAARIEMQQSGPEKAMQWILGASEWPEDDGQGLAWDGKETAREWFDRVMAAEEPAP